MLSFVVAGVFLSVAAGAQDTREAGRQSAAAAACAAREAFEDTLPWTFRGVTYPSRRYFVENFRCGAVKYKFAKQSEEERGPTPPAPARPARASPAVAGAHPCQEGRSTSTST